ncbi:MAG: S8 family peptidase [Myxococcales bacterium]
MIRLGSSSALLVALLSTPALAAPGGTLGRGMQQLVQLYENGNPRLTDALAMHDVSPAGEILVDIRVEDGVSQSQALAQLAPAGFRLQATTDLDGKLLEGYLPLDAARAAARMPGVATVLAVQKPVTYVGKVTTQAVEVQKADLAQANGFDGAGIRVGVLSDSFNFFGRIGRHPDAIDDIRTGDLPADIVVLQDSGSSDEGRGMCQLVHDVAPGAKIAFATGNGGQANFANNILRLRNEFHADVIVDDLIYFAEPMFSDGIVAQAVDKVVASGAAYFSSAGNNGLEAYEADFDAVSPAQAQALVASGQENLDLAGLARFGIDPVAFHNFKNPDGSVSISQKLTSFFGDIGDFQWDEPFDLGKVRTDYNILVFDAQGHFIDPNDINSDAFETLDDNIATDEAIELFAVNPGNFQIVIAKMNEGPASHLKYVIVNGLGESQRENAPAIWGHAAAKGGQAVAAMYYPITDFPEDFSASGPTTIFFDAAGNRLHHPEVRATPQITGIDGGNTTFFPPGGDSDGDGFPNFFGTSAAAPDVAAVAALTLQAAGGPGSLSPEKLYKRLQQTATPVRLARDRTVVTAFAGPVAAAAVGDFPEVRSFWQLAVQPFTDRTVASVAIDVQDPDFFFVNPANPTFGFHIGTARGVTPADIKVRTTNLGGTLTLTFAPGTFAAGDFLTFGNLAVPNLEPFAFEYDADRFAGGSVTVTLDDGAVFSSDFATGETHKQNPFTGAGLVNADAATRQVARGGPGPR